MNTQLTLGNEFKKALSNEGIVVDKDFVVKVYDNSIEFILDDNGKRVFGGEVTITGFKRFGGEREVKINKGSMGSVDITCVATVKTTVLMADIFNKWYEFADLAAKYMDKA